MNEKEKIDKNLLLKCVEIVAGGQEIGRHNTYIYGCALDLYRFIQDQQVYMDIQFNLPDGRIARTIYRSATINQIIEDYSRLKSKELSEEAVQSQRSSDDGKTT